MAWNEYPKWTKLGWVLGRLIGLPARFIGHPNSLLVILSGSLGDALLFSGALREIRRAASAKKIVLVVAERAYPMLRRCPHADVIIPLQMGENGWRRVERVIQAA
ncbi:MAG: hypothetical protein WCS01_16530, partial [bacterium]